MTIDKGILIKNIYYMLSYAFQELRQNNYAEIASEKFDEIYELFTEILIRAISFQLKQGLHREYISQNENLSTIRGKISINGTIRKKIQRSNRVSCDYDELTEDNIFNQILVTTTNQLIRCKEVSQEKKARLKKLMVFFSNVHPIEKQNIIWNALHFNRNNSSYRMLLYVCYFILDGLLMTTEDGQYKMREFSDDHMSRLFEKFVLEYYKKHHPALNANASPVKWNIDKQLSDESIIPAMKTDIMLSVNERTLIIDTKYYSHSMQRQYEKSTIHSNNLYQIHTYVTEHDKDGKGLVDGMLLYAKTQEDITPDGQIRLAKGNTIYFKTLDLNQTFDIITKQLDQLIELQQL